MNNSECRICNNTRGNKIVKAKEKMFGTGDEFNYLECSYCGCLQLVDIPANMNKYYSFKYYSFSGELIDIKYNVKYFLRKRRLKHLLDKNNLIGYISQRIFGKITFVDWLINSNCKSYYKILDVGCGKGQRLFEFRNQGFKNLAGIDNYIEKDIIYENGIRIYKKDILNEDNKYDFIMFHHSFEHISDPFETLKKTYALLNNDRFALIRIPVAAFAYRKYGVNWVQLDAPRHLFLHTLKSMEIISEKSRFKIKKIIFDSNEFQFWGSEQYLRNINLFANNSYGVNPEESIFSKEQITEYSNEAVKLNESRDGDMACFYLYKN